MGGTHPTPPTCRGHPRSSRGGDKQGGALAPPYPRQLLTLGRREEAPGPPWVSWRGDSKQDPRASLGGFPPCLVQLLHPASLPLPPMGCSPDPQLGPLQRGSAGWERAPEKSPSCRTVPTRAAVFRPRANPSGIGCWTLGSPSSANLSKSQFPRHPSCSGVPSCPRTALSLQPGHFHYRPAALSPSQGIPLT